MSKVGLEKRSWGQIRSLRAADCRSTEKCSSVRAPSPPHSLADSSIHGFETHSFDWKSKLNGRLFNGWLFQRLAKDSYGCISGIADDHSVPESADEIWNDLCKRTHFRVQHRPWEMPCKGITLKVCPLHFISIEFGNYDECVRIFDVKPCDANLTSHLLKLLARDIAHRRRFITLRRLRVVREHDCPMMQQFPYV